MDYKNDNTISINGLEFVKFMDHEIIQKRVEELAIAIKKEHPDEKPVFVVLLNGAFVFAADLLRHFNENIETFFIKITSYQDLTSTGLVSFDTSKLDELKGRKLILIEDIIDTGNTMHHVVNYLVKIGVDDLSICSLLVKPGKFEYDLTIKYFGFEISDEFVVGYGLDYNEKGRNLKHIYQKTDN
jgi:hypoxanthine phosphoribosyltransferase